MWKLMRKQIEKSSFKVTGTKILQNLYSCTNTWESHANRNVNFLWMGLFLSILSILTLFKNHSLYYFFICYLYICKYALQLFFTYIHRKSIKTLIFSSTYKKLSTNILLIPKHRVLFMINMHVYILYYQNNLYF